MSVGFILCRIHLAILSHTIQTQSITKDNRLLFPHCRSRKGGVRTLTKAEAQARYRAKLKREAITHYATRWAASQPIGMFTLPACIHCGSTVFESLTLNHIFGHGDEDRKARAPVDGARG